MVPPLATTGFGSNSRAEPWRAEAGRACGAAGPSARPPAPRGSPAAAPTPPARATPASSRGRPGGSRASRAAADGEPGRPFPAARLAAPRPATGAPEAAPHPPCAVHHQVAAATGRVRDHQLRPQHRHAVDGLPEAPEAHALALPGGSRLQLRDGGPRRSQGRAHLARRGLRRNGRAERRGGREGGCEQGLHQAGFRQPNAPGPGRVGSRRCPRSSSAPCCATSARPTRWCGWRPAALRGGGARSARAHVLRLRATTTRWSTWRASSPAPPTSTRCGSTASASGRCADSDFPPSGFRTLPPAGPAADRLRLLPGGRAQRAALDAPQGRGRPRPRDRRPAGARAADARAEPRASGRTCC